MFGLKGVKGLGLRGECAGPMDGDVLRVNFCMLCARSRAEGAVEAVETVDGECTPAILPLVLDCLLDPIPFASGVAILGITLPFALPRAKKYRLWSLMVQLPPI
jgi:hypothetical protein